MKKKVFSLMMMLLLAFTGFVRADELTVHDGTATNAYVPVYGFYADAYLKCEMVYPASELSAMNGGQISSMAFGISSPATEAWTATFEVFVKEVSDATISDFTGTTGATTVYTGTLDGTGSTMTVNFTAPYTYNGGNLLVGFYTTTTGNYKPISWAGETVSGASVQGYNYSSLSSVTASQRDFLPKTTFTYTGGGGSTTQVVEIGSGTTTNSYLPNYEFYNYSMTQQIYTAAEIGTAGTINSLAYYTAGDASRNLDVYMVHTNKTAFSGANDWVVPTAADLVFSGNVTYTSNDWTTITLSTPFEYNGTDNLCLIVDDNTGGYVNSISKYVFTPGGNCSIRIYSDGTNYDALAPSNYSGTLMTEKNLLHLEITTAGGGQGGFQDKLHVKYMEGEEEIIDSLNMGVRPAGYWMAPFNFTMYSEGPTYTVNVLDFTPSDGMFSVEGEELPFQVAPDADVELTLACNGTEVGLIERQFVAITEGDRAAHIWPVVVELYAPEVPDVWELACEEATTFPFVEVPQTAHNMELHNDYTLPFPEIPEGYDAVYKLVFDEDVMLNASVTAGANGKVALYREGFEGEGGPMAHNYYTGPSATGGGASGGGFEAFIGDETSTSTSSYAPFHTLWNYSLSECLYLASELTEAGVTTAPMTSLSYYVSSTSCSTPQNNISIWMGNVSDAELTSTTHPSTGMTLVYTGNDVLPVAGEWNEFEFNAGNFAWDGHSNVVILCQRNNGTYQGIVSWQSHNPGFTGMIYHYSDTNGGYDASVANTGMYTSSTNRPNIIMKSDRAVANRVKRGNRETATVNPHFVTRSGEMNRSGMTNWRNAFRGSTAYGICVYNDGILDLGINQFDIDDMAAANVINSFDDIGGMVYNPNTSHFYVSSYSNSELYEVDADGTILNTVTTDYAIVSLAWDPTTNTLYSMDAYGWLNITDPATGSMTDIDALSNTDVMCITANASGQLYGVLYGDTSALVTIDKTDATVTTICTLNAGCNYAQSMAFDMNDNKLYWAQCYDDDNLYEINPVSGALTLKVANTSEICGLCIPATSSPTPTPTPAGDMAYGPVIENAAVEAGTYYLVASSTDADLEVTINAEDMPCPMVEAEGFVWGETPADDTDGVEPGSVTLRWNIPAYATGWRLVFGSTYYPDPNHPQTIMYPEDGSFATELANSYTVTNLWNNTNYFWHVEFNNDGCPEGVSSPIWGFTTHLNIPQNLTAVDYTVFDDEQIVLNWNAVVDRTYRFYNVYRDGELIGNTQVNNISNTTYTDGPLEYNMEGYTYYVTAVYDEGESAPSDPVTVKVSGYGDVNGHVYEQDGTTGIAGATVTMVGQDEFGVNHTYNFTTNAQGYYTGHIYAGAAYDGQAAKEGYQTAYVPVQGEPIVITYNETTSPIDYILDENFDPVCGVIAEYYPDSLDPNSPYVKVYWGCGLPGSEIIEPFETGDFSLFDWQVDPTYPWTITTTNPYEGTYCMKSGGAGVANVVSNMTVTVNIPADGLMSFFGKISCESSWDYGYFYIDGVQKGSYTGAGNWAEKVFDITAGDHTFQWRYTKDGSVNSNDDCFYVDYITFYKQPAPPIPGMTYDFEDGTMQGWTSVDADGDGYGWYMGSEIMTGQTGNNSSTDFVLSQSYYMGTVLYPDNYLVSPQVQLGGIVRFYACAQDASYAAEHFGLAVSTTNTNPSSFTMVQEWTMTAKSVGEPEGKPIKGQRSGRAQGNWYEYTVDLSAYSGMGYVAIRHFNCSDMFYLNVDDITIGEPGKGIAETRSLDHYRVYRTNCYNDGPYTAENTVLLATVWVPDTVYIDVEWADLEPGIYKWGVGAVYSGNRGEEIEAPINWTAPQAVNRVAGSFASMNGTAAGSHTGNAGVSNRDGWLMYDDGVNIDAIGLTSGGSFYWGVMFPAGSYTGNQLTKVSMFDATAHTGNIMIYQGGDTAPGTLVGTEAYTCTGSEDFAEWTLSTPVAIDPAQNLWIVMNNTTGQYVAAYAAYCGDDNSQWLSLDGVSWDGLYNATGGSLDGTWMIRAYTENGGVTPPTPPTPGTNLNQLALPRESETIWSNCLDKDMWLNGVTVNVLLNSADSPEGTTVDFTNLNEVEQLNYPVSQVVLDESGYYAFESFRRGDYAVRVRHDGYEPIDDTVSIWSDTDLRYVMIEIIYGVGDIYVSRTGWAMWEGEMPVGPTPGPNPGGNTSFSDDFEGGLGNWNLVDADGDGHNWYHSSQSQTYACYDYTGWGHNESDGFAVSSSYTDCTYDSYDPNNFMITNQKYSITASSVLNFWADYGNDSYPDHFGVAVATADNPTPADFTIVWEGSAKSGNAGKSQVRHNGDRYFNWRSHSVDLSAYAGQDVYIAFRHFNSYDQYEIYIDDVELTAGAKSGDRHFEYYKVMCTSIDGVPIFNHNTVYPFCQLSTDEPYNAPLVEGEHYLCKVARVYTTGMSPWSEPVEWVYEPCDHWGPVDEVTVNQNGQGNHIEWVFEHGFNPYGGDTPGPGPQPGENATVILTCGDVWGDGSGYQMLLDADANAYGTTIPETGALSLNCSGNEAIYAEFEYKIPTNADGNCSTQNMVMNNSVSIEIPAGTYDWCITNPTPGDRIWIASAQGNVGGRQNDYAFEAGKTYEFTVTMQGSNDAVNVVVTGGAKGNYAPLAAGEVKDIANVTPGNYGYIVRPAYSTSNMIGQNFNMVSETSLMFNIGDIANYDERVYFLYKLMNDSRFSVINGEQVGMFVVNGNENLNANFMDFIAQNISEFTNMDKYQAADMANAYKGEMPASMVNAMMTDLYIQSRENNMCEFADPFCTDNGMYEFPAGVNAGSGETGPDYDCLYTQPNPAWYYMRIGDPGSMDIHMFSTPEVDIDFCCWGPFDDPTTPCPNGLTEDKVVSCSYSTSWTEHCMIPATAQTGEYYILVITNYSNQPCNINFSMVAGSGSTDCGILPPVDIIGFLITMDGEYLAFADPTDRDFTHEGEFGEHEYCVRPIYPGEMTLPDHNYGWSMGCPVCAETNGQIVCEPGAPIHSELVDANHIKVWWGNAPAAPVSDWLYYDDGTNEDAIGLQNGGSFYWGIKFPAAAMSQYEGCSVTKIGYFDYTAHTGTVRIYNGSNGNAPGTLIGTYDYTATGTSDWVEWTIPAVAFDNTQDLWIVMNNANGQYVAAVGPYTGDPNGTMISTDGSSWYTLADATGGQLSGTWNLRCYVTNQAKGGEIVALDDELNGTPGGVIANSGVSKHGEAPAYMTRAELVKYNVYRSTEATGTYTLIGEVAATGADYYEYIDSPTEAGTYYYQVRAEYDNECESEPAQAADDPSVNYVSETTTADGVDENGSNVALYPNPTKGNVTIEAEGMSRITVVSVLGQVVFDTELDADTYTLNMSQFNAGMYMVRVYTEGGVTVKRVTVMQ
ncbi:MAG: DUF2436 domain-containing protein [Bacteroidaceae bacterium]|nr:DUF2436 domain-containing protein [Bacteroidaceae bacterium]